MMTPEDRRMLIETATDVKWIRDSISHQQTEIKLQRRQLEGVKRRLYYILGAIGGIELVSHLKGVFKL